MIEDRDELLDVLRKMPTEAFGYVVLACAAVVEQNEANHGFALESTKSFVALAFAINKCVGQEVVDMEQVRRHNPRLFPNESTSLRTP